MSQASLYKIPSSRQAPQLSTRFDPFDRLKILGKSKALDWLNARDLKYEMLGWYRILGGRYKTMSMGEKIRI
jgi:hypothetical protein